MKSTPSMADLIRVAQRDQTGSIWDYRIWSPLSFDDEARVEVAIDYGVPPTLTRRIFRFKIVPLEEGDL